MMNSSNSILLLVKCLVVVVLILLATAGIARAAAGEPGYIIINGQREFVLGWFKAGATNVDSQAFSLLVLDEGPEHGFDYAMHYAAWPPHGNGIYEYIQEAEVRGMKVMLDMRPLSALFPTWTSMLNWVGHYGTTVPLKDLPGVYGYYLEDEPDGRSIDPAVLLAKYNEFKTVDPDCIIFTSYYLDFVANATAGYFDATDVAISELYYVSDWWDVENDIAVATAEGIGYIGAPWAALIPGTPGKPAFTPEEFRFVTFSAIADGAGGIMPFYFEGYFPDMEGSIYDPNFRKDNVYPTTDIVAQIADSLAIGKTGNLDANSATFESHNGHYVMGGNEERAVLVAVCHGSTLANVTFELSGLSPDITEAVVLGEDRTIPLTGPSGNLLVDSFEQITGNHVYLFRTPCLAVVEEGGAILGDFNGDCRVNWKDFVSFADEWLK